MKIATCRQLSVAIENQPGRLGMIGRLLAEKGIHISAYCVIDNVEQAMVRLIASDTAMARDLLRQNGLPVVEVEVLIIEILECLSSLAILGEALAKADINIEYAYSSTAVIGNLRRLIVKTPNAREAKEELEKMSESK